jgi:hypothetical protein
LLTNCPRFRSRRDTDWEDLASNSRTPLRVQGVLMDSENNQTQTANQYLVYNAKTPAKGGWMGRKRNGKGGREMMKEER